MLNFDALRFRTSDNLKVTPGSVIEAEGQALVADYSTGEFTVKPATGVANERYVGVAVTETQNQAVLPNIEEFAISNSASATDTVTLQVGTPLAGSLRVEKVEANGTVTNLTAGTPGGSAATTYSVSGNVITFWAPTLDGATLKVTYRYSPTVLQLRELQGDQAPGQTAAATINVTGALQEGDFETSEFDTTIAWSGTTNVTLGANGRFTQGGSGTVVNAIITKIPSAGSPFLGLKFI
ncbi:hypothetical protein GR11A_00074 [Vibrio phage vB_VcorM_GR11A]|nr:hypothetical protein GR11A_00074 [Vibrio phage vB_VcorM_GR11A]